MTKRALSLLLALVMALSLCVPAFAAEAPAAEEPTEAVEAGTEAEASAGAEEEEAAVDAPAVAAVDEPDLTALGNVLKEEAWELEKAVKAAKEFEAAVAAGTVAPKDYKGISDFDKAVEAYKKDKAEGDPFKDVLKGYKDTLADAEELLAGIAGTPTDKDVITSTVKTAASNLNIYVVEGNAKVLTDELDSSLTTFGTTVRDYLTTGTDYKANKSYASHSVVGSSGASGTKLELDWNLTADKVMKGAWKDSYQANYLEALQKAIDAVLAYNKKSGDATYSDYKAVVYAIMDALVLEEQASKPNNDDLARVNALLAQVPEKYVKTDYVLETDDAAFAKLVQAVKDLLAKDTTHTVKFDPSKTLYDVNAAVKALNNALAKKGAFTIQGDRPAEVAPTAGPLSVDVSVKYFDGDQGTNWHGDGYDYYYAYEITSGGKTQWYDTTTPAPSTPPTQFDNKVTGNKMAQAVGDTGWNLNKAGDRLTQALSLAMPTGVNLEVGDSVTLHFYVVKSGVTGDIVYDEVGTPFTIKVVEEPAVVISAKILDAEYTIPTAASVTVPTTKLPSATPSAVWSADESGTQIKVKVYGYEGLTNSNYIRAEIEGTDISSANNTAVNTSASDTSPQELLLSTKGVEEALVGGTNKIVLKYATDMSAAAGNAWREIPGATYELEIESITEWSELAKVQQIVKAAKDLVKSDWELKDPTNNKLQAATAEAKFEEAFGLINKNVSDIEKIVGDASKGNTAANHNAVGASLKDLVTVCTYLKAVSNTEELNEWRELLADANKIIDDDYTWKNDGTGTYTYASLGVLKDLVEEYSTDITATSLKSEIQKAIEAVEQALKALKKYDEVDKSDLYALIAEAKALKEEDYTEESWKAAKEEIDEALAAAEKVAEDGKATQAQVKEAYSKLDAAMAKLEKVAGSDIPEKPTYGDHWAKGKSGNWYYLVDGKAVKDTWVMSTRGIWYYMDENGVMVTGVHNCVSTKGHYDEKTGKYNEKTTWSAGLYYFEQEGSAVPGRVFGGKWVKDANYGDVWAHGQHDGYYGKVEWTKKTGPVSNWKN